MEKESAVDSMITEKGQREISNGEHTNLTYLNPWDTSYVYALNPDYVLIGDVKILTSVLEILNSWKCGHTLKGESTLFKSIWPVQDDNGWIWFFLEICYAPCFVLKLTPLWKEDPRWE